MGCSSVCEKNKDESSGEKLKESLLTLLIKTLFWFGNEALKLVDITTEKNGKN